MKTEFVSKVQVHGRVNLGEEIMKALDIVEGDFVQFIINPEGPQVLIQKVMPYEI